jgi:hypothetical protein
MTQRKEFRAYMKAANSTSDNFDDSHLSEAQMIAYCRGEGSVLEREAAQAHLVECVQCIALFRNARDFLEPARTDEEEITTAQTNEEWQSLLARVKTASSTTAGATGTNVPQSDFQGLRDKKSSLASRVAFALAASLLILLGGLGWLTWRLWQERESLRQSQEVAAQLEGRQQELEQRISQLERSGGDLLKQERDQRLAAEAKRDQLQTQLAAAQQAWQNIQVSSLTLSSERGAQEELQLHFSTSAQAVLLRLLINKPYEFPEYAIELLDQSGEIVRELSGLRPTGDDGRLSVLLNRATLNAGKYRLRLFGQRGTTKKQLGEYGLSVTVGR